MIEIVIVMAIMGILLAVAGPKMLEIMSGAQQSAALQHVRAIHTAQATYYSKFGRFADSLAQLGPPAGSAGRGPQGAGLLPPDLAAGARGGYLFRLAPGEEGYVLTARPSPPKRGERSYYSDGTLVLRYAPGTEEATPESPLLN
ncbi:MAG: type II secretion system protein [Bryobacterales bacterium]|nr:type II secretion system protein [Bryobacterales bacterium]